MDKEMLGWNVLESDIGPAHWLYRIGNRYMTLCGSYGGAEPAVLTVVPTIACCDCYDIARAANVDNIIRERLEPLDG